MRAVAALGLSDLLERSREYERMQAPIAGGLRRTTVLSFFCTLVVLLGALAGAVGMGPFWDGPMALVAAAEAALLLGTVMVLMGTERDAPAHHGWHVGAAIVSIVGVANALVLALIAGIGLMAVVVLAIGWAWMHLEPRSVWGHALPVPLILGVPYGAWKLLRALYAGSGRAEEMLGGRQRRTEGAWHGPARRLR
ncbi:MAG: hypothetical protein U0821_21235 [Chloroflexota bacterium]